VCAYDYLLAVLVRFFASFYPSALHTCASSFAFLLSPLMHVQVAHMGVTIAAVIHQPSYEIFQMFDDILLLAKGGRTAFYGPEGQVQGYFEKLGYALPQRTNPADVYMDIIAGIKSRVDGPPQTPQVGNLAANASSSVNICCQHQMASSLLSTAQTLSQHLLSLCHTHRWKC